MSIYTSPLLTLRTLLDHSAPPQTIDMGRVACIILGGGQGTRLFPLTATHCKPAISFGGRYRLIDVPISNALNSNCHKIFIVTQFLSSSLHRHILHTYHNDPLSSGFIDILSAEQKPSVNDWYKGTADAVRQNLDYFSEIAVDYFLILSGDQLYNIDFQHLVRFGMKTDADVVIATLPIEEKDTKRMGILKVNEHHAITDFYEKPTERDVLNRFKNPAATSSKEYLGSMGIYLFKKEALFRLLQQDSREDFGKHLIPSKVQQGKVFAYLHQGYWEDIGTIGTFYQANIDLTHAKPAFDFYSDCNPIFTSRYNLPGARISNALVTNSIICEGSVIECDEVTHSILGPRTIIRKGSMIRDSYLMGNEFYTPPVQNSTQHPNELFIGEDCLIRKAIIDKNVRIGNGVQLINKGCLADYNSANVFIRDGIIVVPRGSSIPDGFIL